MSIVIEQVQVTYADGLGVLHFVLSGNPNPGDTGPYWSLVGQEGEAQGYTSYDGSGDGVEAPARHWVVAGLPPGRYTLTATNTTQTQAGPVISEAATFDAIYSNPPPEFTPRTVGYSIQIVPCLLPPARPYYLRWLSALGNWEGWAFSGEADTKNSLDGATNFASEDGTTTALARPGAEVVSIRAGNLTTAQHRALGTLLTSPKVYLQAADGARVAVFVVENSTTTRTTGDGRHVMQLEILLPAENALTN